MNTPSKLDGFEGNSPSKDDIDHEEKHTLPNGGSGHHSNTPRHALPDSSVMWAAIEKSGDSTRSGGPEEQGYAAGVPDIETAKRESMAGAPVANPNMQSLTKENFDRPSMTKQSVIENHIENEDKTRSMQASLALMSNVASEQKWSQMGTVSERELNDNAHKLIGFGREYLRQNAAARSSRRDTEASQKTCTDYSKKCKRIDQEMHATGRNWGGLEQVMTRFAQSRQTFSAMKSALKWREIQQLSLRLHQQDQLQKSSEWDRQWYECAIGIGESIKRLKQIDRLKCSELLRETKKSPHASKTKKRDVSKLPKGWQERYLKVTHHSELYKYAAVVMLFTGVRPVEMLIGVQVEGAGDNLVFSIQGGKVRSTAGQPMRRLTLKKEIFPEWFVAKIEKEKQIEVSASPDPMRTYLNRLSDFVFRQEKKSATGSSKKRLVLSAYLMRHALVTELRKEGWSDEEIAPFIGESSAATVRWYGVKSRVSGGSLNPQSRRGTVEASRVVKPLDRSGLQRFKKRKRFVRKK